MILPVSSVGTLNFGINKIEITSNCQQENVGCTEYFVCTINLLIYKFMQNNITLQQLNPL